MTRLSIPGKGTRYFLFSKPRQALGPIRFPFNRDQWYFPWGGGVKPGGGRVKLSQRDGDHSHPSSVEL